MKTQKCTWAGCEQLGTNPVEQRNQYLPPLMYCDEHIVEHNILMRSSIERKKIREKFITIKLAIEELLEEVIEVETMAIAESHRLEEKECK